MKLGRKKSEKTGAAALPHPTHSKLVETVIELLQSELPEELSSEAVLQHAGISRGSLYHHFQDFADLLETALTRMFSKVVDENIALMTGLIERASNRQEILQGIVQFNQVTQSPGNRDLRFNRVRLIGLTYRNPRFTARLSAEQDRLTRSYADLFRLAQQNRWMSEDFDAHAAAVFIQAYTLGRVVDDVATERVDPEQWNDLILKIIGRVFGTDRDWESS